VASTLLDWGVAAPSATAQEEDAAMKPKVILVPLDGSLLAERALPEAIDIAHDSGATLVLLRAAEAHTLPPADPTEAQVAVVRKAEEYLAAVTERVKTAGVNSVEPSVWYGPPAEAIIDCARFRNADLIVMTTHGRSGLGRLVLGSVAETVLRSTTTPILLVREREAPVETLGKEARPAGEISHV
jgi:nucleotide-binding universal stress UspA family protein